MTHTANHSVPEQGKLRRALETLAAWLQILDYSSFDYTLDRINGRESELARLKEELRQIQGSQAPGGTYDGEAVGPTSKGQNS